MRKLLKSIACFATAALVGASAFANYDWYDTSIDIGGIQSNFKEWSRGNGAPDTDLGALTSLTISGVEMKIWDDSNDRGGVNMFFRLYGDDGQIGGNVDVWLGAATRITGDHDFSISYTGPFDLADAFGVTLEEGKTYYLNMWAKSYGDSGDHWYNGDSDNYHTKFVYDANPQKVTFDANGGQCDIPNRNYQIGVPYGMLPTPTLEGQALVGWFDADTGERVKAKYDVPDQATRTLVAQWGAPQSVTFNAGDGDCDVTTMVFAYGGKYEDMPTATWEGHTFAGWYDGNGVRAKNYYLVTDESERTLYAHWRGLKQTVHFDAGDGACTPTSVQCFMGESYIGFPTPTWAGQTFVGWYDETTGTRYKNYTKPVTDASDLYLTARWKGARQTVHFDAGEGQCDKETVQCYIGESYIGFPLPVWEGHTFRGWFDETGTRYKNYTKPVTDAADLYLAAKWLETAPAAAALSRAPRAKAGARAASTVTDTLNYAFTGISGTGYAEWSGKKSVSEALYAGQSGGQYDSIQLRSNNSNSGIVTTKSGGKARKVTVTWNSNTSNGRTLNVYGKNLAYSQATDLYNASSQGTLIGTIVCGTSTELSITDDYEFIGMRSSSSAMYLSEVEIDWEVASSDQSVTLSPADPIEAEVGDEVIITATADGFSGDVTWSWTGSGTPDGNRFTVDTTSAFEAATITATATYGADETASQSVTVTVTAPKHAITIDSTIQNGTVTTDPEDEAAEGATVTVTATADSGYKLGSITVNGSEITGTTFEMPAAPVTVSATFVEKTGGTVTYTVESKTEVSASGDVPDGSSAAYSQTYGTAKQATAGNSFTLTLKGYEGLKIVGLTLRMRSNGSSGAGNLSVTCGDATIASIETAGFGDDSWHGSYTTSYVDVTPAVTTTTVDGDVVIQIAATQNSLYCESYTVEYETVPVEFTITLDPAVDFEVAYNAYATITATPHNQAEGDVSYAWSIDGEPVAGVTGNVLTLDTTVPDVYEAVCTATDAGGAVATASVAYMVNDPPALHDVVVMTDGNGTAEADVDEALPGTTITVTATPNADCRLDAITVNDEAITGTSFEMPNEDALVYVTFEGKHDIEVFAGDHGQASADKDKAYAGETVTLTVTPDDGYKTDTIKVNDETISGTSFAMPADDALVEVTFVEVSDLYFQFEANDLPTGYAAATADLANTGYLAETTPTVAFDIVRACRGTGTTDKKVGNAAMRMAPLQGNDAIAVNVAAFERAIAKVSFQFAIYGTTDSIESAKVQVSADGETWSDLVDLTDAATTDLQTYSNESVPAGMKYIRFVATSSNSSNNHRFNVDEIQIWFEDVPTQTVTFDPNGGECEPLSATYVIGEPYGSLPTPTLDGYALIGWFDADTGERVKAKHEVPDQPTRTLEAQWGAPQTVTFDPGEGECDVTTMVFAYGGKYEDMPGATWENHTFAGWYDATTGERAKNYYPVTEESTRTLVAQWRGLPQTVHFDAGEGQCDTETVQCYIGGTYTGFPMPTWEGHTFVGWFDENGTRYKNYTKPVTDATDLYLTAEWKGLKQTVHFDADEGQCDKETVQCFIGETYIGFPAATRDGYVFRGWFDENGTRYKNYTKPVTDAADLYLTASWKENASASSLAITAFEMKPRAASPATRSAAAATVESTLWFGTYAGTVYEVQWAPAVGGEWIVLKRWTAEEDGEMPVTVDVPAGPIGFFRLVEIAD